MPHLLWVQYPEAPRVWLPRLLVLLVVVSSRSHAADVPLSVSGLDPQGSTNTAQSEAALTKFSPQLRGSEVADTLE